MKKSLASREVVLQGAESVEDVWRRGFWSGIGSCGMGCWSMASTSHESQRLMNKSSGLRVADGARGCGGLKGNEKD